MVNSNNINTREFITTVNSLIEKYKDGKNVTKEIKNTYRTYFFDKNDEKIEKLNFDNSYFEDIKIEFQKEPTNPEIFVSALNKVLTDLKLDTFNTFLTTNEFNKIKLQNQRKCVSKKFQHSFTEEHFKDANITEIDSYFFEHLNSSTPDWTMLDSKKGGMKTYFLMNNYFPIKTFCQNGKYFVLIY
jgi:hypothetical protein